MTVIRRTISAILTMCVALVGLVAISTSASAATPPWEPDAGSIGAIHLYDASGTAITSGSTSTSPFAAFALADTARDAADNKATAYLAVPTPGTDPAAWPKLNFASASSYPDSDAGAPAAVKDQTGKPLYIGTASDFSIDDIITDGSHGQTSTTAGYENMYQLRIVSTHAGGSVSTTPYDSIDLLVDPSAHTWTVAYGGQTETATKLDVSPTGPAAAGTQETLTAHVTPTDAAGSVEFFDGADSLGSSTVSSGTATKDVTLPSGAHTLTATFTPTSNAYAPSTSTGVSYTVNAVSTSTSVQASPLSSAAAGTSVTFTGTVSPSNAVGSVQFFDGATNIGTHVVSGGTASITTSVLALGGHSIVAKFVPTSSASFTASQSSALPYTITSGTTTANPPANTAAPSLTGTDKVGTNVSCSNGTWTDAASFTYEFSANGAVVQAAGPNATLALTPALVGKTVTCKVTATGPGGAASASSAGVKVLPGAPLHAVKAPKITGTAKKGKTLKVSPGTWSPKASKYSYQWKRNGKSIKGATKATFRTSKADVGKKLSCTVTATAVGYTKGTATTKAVTVKA